MRTSKSFFSDVAIRLLINIQSATGMAGDRADLVAVLEFLRELNTYEEGAKDDDDGVFIFDEATRRRLAVAVWHLCEAISAAEIAHRRENGLSGAKKTTGVSSRCSLPCRSSFADLSIGVPLRVPHPDRQTPRACDQHEFGSPFWGSRRQPRVPGLDIELEDNTIGVHPALDNTKLAAWQAQPVKNYKIWVLDKTGKKANEDVFDRRNGFSIRSSLSSTTSHYNSLMTFVHDHDMFGGHF